MLKEGPTTVLGGEQQKRENLLPVPLRVLRAFALLVAACTMQPMAEPLPTKCEAVKYPPKPGEDDGIYGEGVARTQRMDF